MLHGQPSAAIWRVSSIRKPSLHAYERSSRYKLVSQAMSMTLIRLKAARCVRKLALT